MPRTFLLTALLLGLTNVAVAQDFDTQGEAQMLERINALRTENELAPVQRLDTLDAVARAHSAEMATNGQLAHVSTTTGTPEDRVRGAGVASLRVTENVANHRDTMGAHGALLNSPPHRQNVLDPSVTHVGLGSVRTDRGVFVTQVYAGLPAEEAVAPTPEPVLQEEAPAAPSFELIPPFVERAMEEVAAPVIAALGEAAPMAAAPEAAPVEASPEAAPVEAAPVDAAPVEAAPVEAAPVPFEAAPVEAAPASAPPAITDAPPAPEEQASAPAANPGAATPLTPLAQQTLRGLVGIAQSLLGGAPAGS